MRALVTLALSATGLGCLLARRRRRGLAGVARVGSGEGVWLGDAQGPVRYADYQLAQVAARVINTRLALRPGTVKPRPLSARVFKFKDQVTTIVGNVAAIRHLEGDPTPVTPAFPPLRLTPETSQ